MSEVEVTAHCMYAVLQSGGLVMACTDTGFGLVAMKTEAIRRIYALKGRVETKPCVTVGTLPIVDEVARELAPAHRAFLVEADQKWPLAVIVHHRPEATILARVEPFVAQQTRRDDTMALFFGVGPVIRRCAELAYADGELIFGSSANVSGTGNHYNLFGMPDELLGGVDLVIPGKPKFDSPERLASTIVDFTTGTIQRRGVEAAAVEQRWLAVQAQRAA
jgi:tRNA A37 threonylcarbamoyladenosine synthetase subunit TsaC/SUA5/YrdC